MKQFDAPKKKKSMETDGGTDESLPVLLMGLRRNSMMTRRKPKTIGRMICEPI
jgi:hypothetical protein